MWGFADLTSDTVPVIEQGRRVALMCAAYPAMTPEIVVTELTAQFERARQNHLAAGRPGPLAVFENLLEWMSQHRSMIINVR